MIYNLYCLAKNAQHKEVIFPEGQQQTTISQHKHLNLHLVMEDVVVVEILSIISKSFLSKFKIPFFSFIHVLTTKVRDSVPAKTRDLATLNNFHYSNFSTRELNIVLSLLYLVTQAMTLVEFLSALGYFHVKEGI